MISSQSRQLNLLWALADLGSVRIQEIQMTLDSLLHWGRVYPLPMLDSSDLLSQRGS